MANIVTMLGGKEAKTYESVLADFNAEMEPPAKKREEIAEGYKAAEATIRALEQSRRGGENKWHRRQ